MDLGDHHDARRVGRMHDVALIDQPETGAAVDRRLDRRVVELGLRIVDRRLIALDQRLGLRDQGVLGVDLLVGSEVFLRQIQEACQIELGILERGDILRLLGDGLIEGCPGTGGDRSAPGDRRP